MLEEDKNLKDTMKSPICQTSGNYPQVRQMEPVFISYSKTNKLVTALYMVTDILDINEPIKNKLRTLAVEILSDTMSKIPFDINKIDQVLSLLDISLAMNLISEMNCNILKKEFTELKQSVEESKQSSTLSLSEFFNHSPIEEYPLGEGGKLLHPVSQASHPSRGELKGQATRIGIQKGGTLLKALKDIKEIKTSKTNKMSNRISFNNLKKERREAIIKIIKACPSSGVGKGATITDIKNSASGALVSCGEKTLQRELVSMVSDGVLKKIGEKRWSKYFL